jgi:hypothetical protein
VPHGALLPAEFDRRAFFTKLGLGSLGIAAADTVVFSYEFLSPNVLYKPSAIVNVGMPDSFAVNSVTMDVNSGIYLVRAEEGFFAVSAVTPGKSRPVALEIVETALGYQQRVGSILVDKYCKRCHDPESPPERVSNYDNLEVKPHPFTEGNTLNKMSVADLTSIILHGGPALNRSALMPPYGNTLSAADVRALIAYTRAVADLPYQPAGRVYARK